jgi:uncharacterized phiE125 gp8 family phage protein
MSITYKVTTEPTTEPVTLEEFREALRIGSCDFDGELTELLKACRQAVELDSYRKFVTQTVTMYLDEFPPDDEIEFRLSPISAVVSVNYYDQSETFQTLPAASYWTNLVATPPEICLKPGYVWPSTELDRPNAVEIVLTCGYGAASAVPPAAKLAIKELGKLRWHGCEGDEIAYKRLLSVIQWTGHGVAQR